MSDSKISTADRLSAIGLPRFNSSVGKDSHQSLSEAESAILSTLHNLTSSGVQSKDTIAALDRGLLRSFSSLTAPTFASYMSLRMQLKPSPSQQMCESADRFAVRTVSTFKLTQFRDLLQAVSLPSPWRASPSLVAAIQSRAMTFMQELKLEDLCRLISILHPTTLTPSSSSSSSFNSSSFNSSSSNSSSSNSSSFNSSSSSSSNTLSSSSAKSTEFIWDAIGHRFTQLAATIPPHHLLTIFFQAKTPLTLPICPVIETLLVNGMEKLTPELSTDAFLQLANLGHPFSPNALTVLERKSISQMRRYSPIALSRLCTLLSTLPALRACFSPQSFTSIESQAVAKMQSLDSLQLVSIIGVFALARHPPSPNFWQSFEATLGRIALSGHSFSRMLTVLSTLPAPSLLPIKPILLQRLEQLLPQMQTPAWLASFTALISLVITPSDSMLLKLEPLVVAALPTLSAKQFLTLLPLLLKFPTLSHNISLPEHFMRLIPLLDPFQLSSSLDLFSKLQVQLSDATYAAVEDKCLQILPTFAPISFLRLTEAFSKYLPHHRPRQDTLIALEARALSMLSDMSIIGIHDLIHNFYSTLDYSCSPAARDSIAQRLLGIGKKPISSHLSLLITSMCKLYSSATMPSDVATQFVSILHAKLFTPSFDQKAYTALFSTFVALPSWRTSPLFPLAEKRLLELVPDLSRQSLSDILYSYRLLYPEINPPPDLSNALLVKIQSISSRFNKSELISIIPSITVAFSVPRPTDVLTALLERAVALNSPMSPQDISTLTTSLSVYPEFSSYLEKLSQNLSN